MPSKARLPDGWQHTASRSHVTSHECNITFISGSHPLENNINMVPAAYSVYGLLCYARCKQHGGWYCWVLLGIVGYCWLLLGIVGYCLLLLAIRGRWLRLLAAFQRGERRRRRWSYSSAAAYLLCEVPRRVIGPAKATNEHDAIKGRRG